MSTERLSIDTTNSPGGSAQSLASETLKLDLGSGPRPRDGYLGVDRNASMGVVAWNFASHRPWPWPGESVDALYSSHLIEHLPPTTPMDQDVLVHFFEEAYRVAKPGALFQLRWPAAFHPETGLPLESAWLDPTHYRHIPAQQIPIYFSSAGRRTMGVQSYGIRCNWVPTRDIEWRVISPDGRVIELDIEIRREPLLRP